MWSSRVTLNQRILHPPNILNELTVTTSKRIDHVQSIAQSGRAGGINTALLQRKQSATTTTHHHLAAMLKNCMLRKNGTTKAAVRWRSKNCAMEKKEKEGRKFVCWWVEDFWLQCPLFEFTVDTLTVASIVLRVSTDVMYTSSWVSLALLQRTFYAVIHYTSTGAKSMTWSRKFTRFPCIFFPPSLHRPIDRAIDQHENECMDELNEL